MTDSRTLGQRVLKEGLFLMDGIEGLRSLPKHSVDMLLTDPPYGTTRNYWDVPLPLPELWEAVKWAVKPNGAVLFFAQCPFDKVLGASNLAMLRYEWVWYKERGTGFLNANRAPLKKSENILVFYQKSPVYNPQFTYGKPYTRVHSRSGTCHFEEHLFTDIHILFCRKHYIPCMFFLCILYLNIFDITDLSKCNTNMIFITFHKQI